METLQKSNRANGEAKQAEICKLHLALGTLPPYAKTLIKCKTQTLVGVCGIQATDLDAIQQELGIELFNCLPNFDGTKAKLTTFMQRIVERKISNLLRERCTFSGLNRQQESSLSEVVDIDEFGMEVALGDQLDSDQYLRRHLGRTRNSQEEHDLAMDVQELMQSLPEDLQVACRYFLEGASTSEVAKLMDIKRSEVYRSVIQPLRKAFSFAGMKKYFQP